MIWESERHTTLKGLAAGAIGGAVASFVMSQFQMGLKKWTESAPPQGHTNRPQRRAAARKKQQVEAQELAEDATVKTATAVAETVFDHELEPEERAPAGAAVHYAFGSLMGGLYGMAAEEWEPVRTGEGALFGAALWFGSDEIAVPALKLSKPPQDYPWNKHAQELAAHVVYGVTTELVRRALRAGVFSK